MLLGDVDNFGIAEFRVNLINDYGYYYINKFRRNDIKFDRDMDVFAFGMAAVHSLSEGSLYSEGEFSRVLKATCSTDDGKGFYDFVPQFVERLDIPSTTRDMFLEFFASSDKLLYIGEKLDCLRSDDSSFIKIKK